MKRKITTKKISFFYILTIALLFFPGISGAQSIIQTITPVQAGTLLINNGRASITLNKEVTAILDNPSSSYYVTFTAVGLYTPLSIVEKNNASFKVQVASSNINGFKEAKVDYIVFVKEERPLTQASTTKQNASMKLIQTGSGK